MPKAQVQFLDDKGGILFSAAATVDPDFPTRFFAGYRAIYGQDMTDMEVWNKFTGGLMLGIVANIQNGEKVIAQAALQPASVKFTPTV